jgi:2-polyprenyl-6-methoxyphenol hydroxylase-like FAD-dependent oxidoreductase
MKTEVLIVGAGPTGLMAACQLARFGVDFIIVDIKSKPTDQSKAMTVTARSLEIYQQMGLSDAVFQSGRIVPDISLLIAGQDAVNLTFNKGGKGLTDFPYSFTLEQSANEKILYDYLKGQDKDVLWNTSFIDMVQYKDGVSCRLKMSTGQEDLLTARYLIASDGSGSSVRRVLKYEFKGKTYKQRFFIADSRVLWEQTPQRLISTVSRSNFFSFFPMYADQNYRVSGVVPEAFADQENVSFDEIEKVIRSTIQVPFEIAEVHWFSVYRLHNRCVKKFRAGNCFLAGDAAHVHSPAGGQGMNAGLQEAYNLAWKMSLVLRNYASQRLLDTYHMERYPFAKWLLGFTDRIFTVLVSRNPLISCLRVQLAPLLMKRMAKQKEGGGASGFKKFSQIWYGYRKSPLSVQDTRQRLGFRAGDRFPYVMTAGNGKTQSCYHLLTEAKFHLVIIEEELNRVADKAPGQLLAPQLAPIVKVLRLPLSMEWEALGLSTQLYILVRPDNYIAMISDHLNERKLSAYFCRLKDSQ